MRGPEAVGCGLGGVRCLARCAQPWRQAQPLAWQTAAANNGGGRGAGGHKHGQLPPRLGKPHSKSMERRPGVRGRTCASTSDRHVTSSRERCSACSTSVSHFMWPLAASRATACFTCVSQEKPGRQKCHELLMPATVWQVTSLAEHKRWCPGEGGGGKAYPRTASARDAAAESTRSLMRSRADWLWAST
jgi:hypothetical protein